MAQSSPPNPDRTSELGEQAKRDAEDAKRAVQADIEDLKRRAGEETDELKREVRSEIDRVQKAAGRFADEQKDYAAEQLSGIASALERVEQDLNERDQRWAGEYAGDVARRLSGLAQHARSSSFDELIGDVEEFGRRNPAAFLGAAAMLGFAASRFLTASASRRSSSDDYGTRYPQSGYQPGDGAATTSSPVTDGGQSSNIGGNP